MVLMNVFAVAEFVLPPANTLGRGRISALKHNPPEHPKPTPSRPQPGAILLQISVPVNREGDSGFVPLIRLTDVGQGWNNEIKQRLLEETHGTKL